jgi:hypothetical protein
VQTRAASNQTESSSLIGYIANCLTGKSNQLAISIFYLDYSLEERMAKFQDFKTQCLNLHNVKRKLHEAQPLKLDEDVALFSLLILLIFQQLSPNAQVWAKECARDQFVRHGILVNKRLSISCLLVFHKNVDIQ